MFRAHHAAYGTAPDGRLFRGTRGGPLSGSLYGRAWQSARVLALGPELAAGGLARRPYDLRHAALSLWLNAGGDPRPDRRPGRAQRRSPAHRLQPLHPRPRRPPQPADQPRPRATRGTWSVPVRGKPAVHPTPQLPGSQRLHRPRDGRGRRRPCVCGRRPLCVRGFPARPADGPQFTPTAGHCDNPTGTRLASSKATFRTMTSSSVWPTAGPQTVREPLATTRKAGATIQ